MVNKVHKMKTVVVKAGKAKSGDPSATSKGGLTIVRNIANHLRLWTEARKELPARKDPRQGYETVSVVSSVVHGLLAGGHGYCATEPMREDTPLLKMLGMDRAPSAETVEEVVKYLGHHKDGHKSITRITRRFVKRCIRASSQQAICSLEGFVPLWSDGTLLEVSGKNFDSIKVIKNKRGQLCVGGFVGPWLTGINFAKEGQGEETLVRDLLKETIREVLHPLKLMKHVLVLLDSLHGDGPTFDILDWKEEGDMFWHYAGVVTNLKDTDPRVKKIMKGHSMSYEEVIWYLYSKKQGMENQWKDLLRNMELHNPPCAKACVNALFYAIAGIAYNISVAVRRLTLTGKSRRMQLWRLRRDVFDLCGYVVKRAGNVIHRRKESSGPSSSVVNDTSTRIQEPRRKRQKSLDTHQKRTQTCLVTI